MSEQTGATERCDHVVANGFDGYDNDLWECEDCGQLFRHQEIDGGPAHRLVNVKIVPADAVCITPEIAATLEEAAHNAAIDAEEQAEKALMECMSPLEADEWHKAAESYRAAAAALRGEG